MRLRVMLACAVIPVCLSCSEDSGQTVAAPGYGGTGAAPAGVGGAPVGGVSGAGTGGVAATGGVPPVTGGTGGAGTGGTSGGTAGNGGTGGTGSTAGTGNTAGTGGNGGTGSTNTGGYSGSVSDPPRITNPTPGFATHYWDCCKPHCGWTGNANPTLSSCTQSNQSLGSNYDEQSACSGGSAFQCWNMAPWAVSDTLAYGFAAHNNVQCGTCFQLEFTGTSHSNPNDAGAPTIRNKIMIVQVVNTGGIAGEQFDLLVPGGGVGDFDACTRQWGVSDLGERYGGYFLQCRNQNQGNLAATQECVRSKCQATFNKSGMTDLLDGCLWWAEWMNVADNPNLNFQQVECPAAIKAVSKI